MERYIGLDVHGESCTFSVLSESGREVDRQVVETNGRALVSYVRQVPGTVQLCTEGCEWSQWLYEVLSPCVEEMVVLWPQGRDAAKSGALDARHLAERLRTGRLGGVQSSPTIRAVAGAGAGVRAFEPRRGIQCTGSEIYDPGQRARWLQELPAGLRSSWRSSRRRRLNYSGKD